MLFIYFNEQSLLCDIENDLDLTRDYSTEIFCR